MNGLIIVRCIQKLITHSPWRRVRKRTFSSRVQEGKGVSNGFPKDNLVGEVSLLFVYSQYNKKRETRMWKRSGSRVLMR